MSTPQTAQVYITNTTDGTAKIQLWHNNSDYGTESGTWTAAPGQTVGPLTVHFNTGWGSYTVLDYWACEIVVTGGSTPGRFESTGILQYSSWKEYQLQGKDAGQNLVFTVSSTSFVINLKSGGGSTPMNPVARLSAQAYLTNNTGGNATLTLFHNNSTDGTQSATWTAAPGQTVGPLTVYFRVGLNVGFVLDYWAVKAAVKDGPNPGVYTSSGFASMTNWKECQLQQSDVNQNLPLTVDLSSFAINLPSGGCSAGMVRTGPYTLIDNVFVLMLENHSFENVFGQSDIAGITRAPPGTTNSFDSRNYANSPAPPIVQSYPVGPNAPFAMPTDPGHEWLDTLEQLLGPEWGVQYNGPNKQTRTPWTPYNQPVVNTGFVSNYATTVTEITSNNPSKPTSTEYGDPMLGFTTQTDLPVIYALATEFAICDAWHASVPGPTWPNRFFVHGASSGGWADSPSSLQTVAWETPGGGFVYPSGASIYDRLSAAGLSWRVYVDENGPVFGGIPQVAALQGITYKVNTNNFGSFAQDVQGPYPYAYTFIESNYGDTTGGSYEGGSSQHPMDSMAGGEGLIKATYEAIRNSPLWERSLLIITYDEHGGFYDSVQPQAAPPPNDGSPRDLSINDGGFLFDWYGVRVPAVLVSPLIPKGVVDKTLYDHASVPATLEALFGLQPMTARDAAANTVLAQLSLATPRTDCPTVLPAVAPEPPRAAPAVDPNAPLPQDGNTIGFIRVLAKTDIDLARGDPAEVAAIEAQVAAITTVGEAEAYGRQVIAKAAAAQAAANPAATAPPPRPPSEA